MREVLKKVLLSNSLRSCWSSFAIETATFNGSLFFGSLYAITISSDNSGWKLPEEV